MRKWKIRFVLPVCLCCLLVCGMAVGSRYAWGRHPDAAGHGCLVRLSVRPCGACRGTCPGLGWGCFPLHQPDCGGRRSRCARGVDGDMSPYFAGDLSQRFTQNCVSALEVPLEWGFSVDAGNTHGQLLSVEKGVGYKGPGALPRHQLADHHLHLYPPRASLSTPWRSSATGIPPQLCWKTKTASGRCWSRTSKSRSSPQTATSPSKAGFPPIQRPWSL